MYVRASVKGLVDVPVFPKSKEVGDKTFFTVAMTSLNVFGNAWGVCGREYLTLDADNNI